MAVDKSLMEAPQGIAAMAAEMEPIEIEIVDPEEVRIGVDGMMIELSKEEPLAEDFDANLGEYMNESELQSLASELIGNYEQDLASRKDWLDTYVKGLKILGIRYEDRTEPWPGACGVFHPLLMESAVKFQSETIIEIFPGWGRSRRRLSAKKLLKRKTLRFVSKMT